VNDDDGADPNALTVDGKRRAEVDPFEELLREVAAAPSPPPSPWETLEQQRYRIVALLGGGGGGQVYKAFDEQLGREVALKFLNSVGPEHTAQLVKEARTQARVKHPGICQVYEVVESVGRPFIAMQLIEGPTLAAAAAELSLAEKVTILRLVAEAVEAAHQLGIVHRDLKPANVLVERAPDGGLRPYVTDFGLAREVDKSLTAGMVGTPNFMAPEQARGDIDAIGPLTDVWALGATLYQLLAGKPPFDGASIMSILRSVELDEPARLPSLPRELEAIVFRCLEKTPAKRYPSAAALARDLEAFERGEPVVARRRSLWRRAGVVVARRWPLALALVGALVFAGFIQARVSATRRVRAARELGQSLSTMRSTMRAARMLPLHDIEPDREKVRAEMNRIAAVMRTLGDEGRAPGEFALGAGWFALGDRKQARAHLEAAWAAGERSPDLAYDLGVVLGTAYYEAKQFPPALDEAARARYDAELDRTLRAPAIAYLRAAAGAADTSPAYVDALVAFYDGRYEDVIARAQAAVREMPTLYEAEVLAGRAHGRRAEALLSVGQLAAAKTHFAEADAAFTRAQEIGRSDESVYMVFGDSVLAYASHANHLGEDPGPMYQRVLEACERGRRADSRAASPDELEAFTAWLLGFVEVDHGRDPLPALQRAIAAAGRAIARDPQSVNGHVALAEALINVGRDEVRHGRDPRASFQRAIDAFEAALKVRADLQGYCHLGVTWGELARWQMAHGLDASRAVEADVAANEQAARMDPRDPDTALMPCRILADWAMDRVERGRDAGAVLARANQRCSAAEAVSSGDPRVLHRVGKLDHARALLAWQAGDDPLPELDRAQAKLERVIALDATDSDYRIALARALVTRADYLTMRGRDASGTQARALVEAKKAVEIAPTDPLSWLAVALAQRAAARAGRDPARAIADGLAATARALATKSDDAETLLVAAELHLLKGRVAQSKKRSVAVAAAEGMASRALAIDEGAARAFLIRAGLARLTGDAPHAEEALAAALAANPRLATDPLFAMAHSSR
jgi:serine/threonine-protein kinase